MIDVVNRHGRTNKRVFASSQALYSEKILVFLIGHMLGCLYYNITVELDNFCVDNDNK